MDSAVTQIMSRIESIQARIDSIAGTPLQPPAGAGSFAGVLNSASGAGPALDPTGEPVRPLGAAAFESEINAAAQKYRLDPALIKAVVQVESGGNPDAVSHAGAMGLMQLMPSNVAEAGVTNPFDPAQNIDAGSQQLSRLLGQFGGNLDYALAAYNAGPNAVRQFGGIPPYPETQGYVRRIHSILEGS